MHFWKRVVMSSLYESSSQSVMAMEGGASTSSCKRNKPALPPFCPACNLLYSGSLLTYTGKPEALEKLVSEHSLILKSKICEYNIVGPLADSTSKRKLTN